MAKVIINDQEFEVEDGSPVAEVCEQAGIPFSCKDGTCGICQVEVVEGAENLSDKNEKEKALTEDGMRLSCQTRIMKGTVILKSWL